MGPRYISTTFLNEQEDTENSPENSGESPKSGRISSSSSSPKKSKKSIQKRRVISVPIKDVEGYRIKGEVGAAPPSDCWAWRKYGQKPIKGSPYPRGYYRCSSSKGCPARKQVERSNVDAKLLIITYSCEHNHTYPPTKNNKIVSAKIYEEEEEDLKPIKIQPAKSSSEEEVYSEIDNSNDKLGNFGEESLIGGINDYYGLWFSDHFECTSSNFLLEDPIFTAEERVITDSDMAMAFTNVREEDESFFSDLGELPEFSTVFRGGRMMKREEEEEEEHRRHGLTPWCGTTT